MLFFPKRFRDSSLTRLRAENPRSHLIVVKGKTPCKAINLVCLDASPCKGYKSEAKFHYLIEISCSNNMFQDSPFVSDHFRINNGCKCFGQINFSIL